MSQLIRWNKSSQHPGIPDHCATICNNFSARTQLCSLFSCCSNFINCQLGQPQSEGCQICLISASQRTPATPAVSGNIISDVSGRVFPELFLVFTLFRGATGITARHASLVNNTINIPRTWTKHIPHSQETATGSWISHPYPAYRPRESQFGNFQLSRKHLACLEQLLLFCYLLYIPILSLYPVLCIPILPLHSVPCMY